MSCACVTTTGQRTGKSRYIAAETLQAKELNPAYIVIYCNSICATPPQAYMGLQWEFDTLECQISRSRANLANTSNSHHKSTWDLTL